MFAEFGNFVSYLALILSLALIALPFLDQKRSYVVPIATLQFACLSISFLSLILSFALSDFSVLLVANNSHTMKPLIYKISAAWGNHEGSLLMWTLCLSFFSLIFLISTKNSAFRTITLAIQSFITALFLVLMLAVSSPFTRIFPSPINGMGLNPILQDIGLAMHPPVLYLGYVGFSIAFSACIAALLTRTDDETFVKSILWPVRLSWSLLTLGITLGSWWAYRELGWGGFWFWDPVENSSLMPWLPATALIHALISHRRTNMFRSLVYTLSLITFVMSVVGTFLVRSGIITSVHSFATDPKRGVFILMILTVLSLMAVVSFAKFFLYEDKSVNSPKVSIFSKAGLIASNNFILIFFAFVVSIGTVYPLFLELFTSDKISVGAPYFNSYLPFIIPAFLVICIASYFTSWAVGIKKISYVSYALCLASAIFTIAILFVNKLTNIVDGLIVFLALWLILINIHALSKLPSIYTVGYKLAHIGFGIVVLSITLNFALQKDTDQIMKVGTPVDFAGFRIELTSIDYDRGANYITRRGTFISHSNSSYIGMIEPEMRLYTVEQQQTAEAGILHKPFYDLYITIGELKNNDSVVTRLSYRPMMNFLWLGGLLIFFGGVSLFLKPLIEVLNVRLLRFIRRSTKSTRP